MVRVDGYDLDPASVELALRNVAAAGLGGRVRVHHADITTAPMTRARPQKDPAMPAPPRTQRPGQVRELAGTETLLSRRPRRPARERAGRALKSERLRLLGWQPVRRHPEVMVGGAGQRDVINWAVRARQAEALGDLGRAAAVRARYEGLHGCTSGYVSPGDARWSPL
jgi:hypothetical protein